MDKNVDIPDEYAKRIRNTAITLTAGFLVIIFSLISLCVHLGCVLYFFFWAN